MNKRFIVLTDLSEESSKLLLFAARWAEKVNATIVVAHQATTLAPGMGESEILSGIKRRNKQNALRELHDFTYKTLGHVRNTRFHVTTSNIETSLARLNRSKQLDVIFVGIKREKSIIEKWLTESTAVKLSNDINKLIISIPVDTTDFNFDSLYIAVKQAYPINEGELRNLITISAPMFQHISFLSVVSKELVNGETETYLGTLSNKYAERVPISCEVQYADNESAMLNDYISTKDNSIIAIQKGPRNLLDIFRKYHVNSLLKDGSKPLIIIPNGQE